MGDELERKETRGMKLIQEAIISEPSLLLSLVPYVECTWRGVLVTLDKVMINTGFLVPSDALGVVQTVVSFGTR